MTFDEEVETIFGPAPAGDPAALVALARVQAGGSTNLSGGWLKGRKLVQGAEAGPRGGSWSKRVW